MADRPILFSAPMIRALIEGRKTQTRRIAKPQCGRVWQEITPSGHLVWKTDYVHKFGGDAVLRLPAELGDRLWVREAWRTTAALGEFLPRQLSQLTAIRYEATRTWRDETVTGDVLGRLRPGIHMPRWASRLTLTVTDVRVERLQDISEADAVAEGVQHQNVITDVKCYGGPPVEIHTDRYWNGTEPDDFEGHESAVDAYSALWDSINGPGAWDANPWVVAISFTVARGNSDAMGAINA